MTKCTKVILCLYCQDNYYCKKEEREIDNSTNYVKSMIESGKFWPSINFRGTDKEYWEECHRLQKPQIEKKRKLVYELGL